LLDELKLLARRVAATYHMSHVACRVSRLTPAAFAPALAGCSNAQCGAVHCAPPRLRKKGRGDWR
jgi:hypothetical protein